MIWYITKTIISAIIIVAVSELAGKSPRWGALILSLPIVSIIALVMTWQGQRNMVVVAGLAKETLVLVPLGLGFFIPLAMAARTGLSFWPSFFLGIALAGVTISIYFFLSSRSLSLPH